MLNAALPYNNLASIVVSGTTTITSSATNIMYLNGTCQSITWTGAPQGTIQMLASVDYNPGIPMSHGTFNAGNWATVPFVNSAGSVVTSVTIGSGTAQPILMNAAELYPAWVQIQYTNTTASGVISGWICGKSDG